MCCLFGLYDYGHCLSSRQKNQLISALAVSAEARGTDATGIAYLTGTRLNIYKRPLPAHRLRLRVPQNADVVMGHTRMTTQGSERRNYNTIIRSMDWRAKSGSHWRTTAFCAMTAACRRRKSCLFPKSKQTAM